MAAAFTDANGKSWTLKFDRRMQSVLKTEYKFEVANVLKGDGMAPLPFLADGEAIVAEFLRGQISLEELDRRMNPKTWDRACTAALEAAPLTLAPRKQRKFWKEIQRFEESRHAMLNYLERASQ